MSPALELDLDVPLSYDLKETMTALFTLGYWLHPLGDGPDGKKPTANLVDKRLPLPVVAKCMLRSGREMYGIRCAGLVVVDLDNRHPETLQYAEERFGCSPYRVQTARGEHWYFRLGDAAPNKCSIRTGSIAVDVKHGANANVVGPGSIRPDTGDRYEMIGEPLAALLSLPVFQDRESRSKQSTIGSPATGTSATGSPVVVDVLGRGVPEGQRFKTLKAKAREFARNVSSEQELHASLVQYVQAAFEDPASFELRKITEITQWTWQKRREGNLWGGEKSAAVILRSEYLALDQFNNGVDAQRLLAELRHNHANQPGKRFGIATHSMAKCGVIKNWSESRYRRARDTLITAGYLRQVKKGFKGVGPNLYQLSLPFDEYEVVKRGGA